MSRSSEYTLDFVIKDDRARKALSEIESGFKELGKEAKEAVNSDDIEASLKSMAFKTQVAIAKMQKIAASSPVDYGDYFKTFSKGARKAIGELEKQYADLIPILEKVKELEAQKKNLEEERKLATTLEERQRLESEIQAIETELNKPNQHNIRLLIRQNRQMRVNLETARRSSQLDLITERKKNALAKLADLTAKRKATQDKAEKKLLSEQIKLQEKQVKTIKQAEKQQMAIVKATEKQAKALQEVIVRSTKVQKLFKALSFIRPGGGGGGLLAKANHIASIAGNGTTAIGNIAKAGHAMISGTIGSVSAVADREVEKERLANRVKGFNQDDAKDILGKLYIQTGADYGVIVDAINRVQNVLKSKDKGELIAAAATEIRYPGSAQSFASSNTDADAANFIRYGNRLKAIQHATGASDEQVQASMELLNNLEPDAFKSATVTDLQSVYLGLQNSGAFDSQEELDKAFKRFVRDHSKSGQNAFEFAQNYDWSKTVSGDRNKLQAANTLGNLNWSEMGDALNKPEEQQSQKPSEAETMAMKMRQMEEKKNQLMMKLIPVVLPVVEGIAHLMDTNGDEIVKGFVSLFEKVIPMLTPIFTALGEFLRFMGETILPAIQGMAEAVMDWFGSDEVTPPTSPKNANGGIVWGKSIVGERGPEAIIPLDYSRAQRAENIAYSIQNNFSMSGNETTALSLAQAVSSRDFSRAMGKAAFKAGRLGAF